MHTKPEMFICPKCKKLVMVNECYDSSQRFLGLDSGSQEYTLIADWIYHFECWSEIEKENAHMIGPSAIVPDSEDQLMFDF